MKNHVFKAFWVLLIVILSSCYTYTDQYRQSSTPSQSLPPPPPRIPYWTLNVVVDNFSLSGRASTQTAYFFKDLKSMEDLTGFPRGDFKTSYRWKEIDTNRPHYVNQIFSTMRNENFVAAFVCWGTGTNIYGEPYWLYNVYCLWNGIEYFDGITRTNRPVRF